MSALVPQAIAIIPARLGSTRLPGKVLLSKTGKPLIQHVWEAARRSRRVSRVLVATDDRRVCDTAKAFGAEVVLTSTAHPNGTSRLSEAARVAGLADDALIVNVQGDEPELEPEAIDAGVDAYLACLRTGTPADIATLAVPFSRDDARAIGGCESEAAEHPDNPNCVKVVLDTRGFAMYFSRSRIPCDRDGTGGPEAACLRHIGLYVYTRQFLDRYLAMTPTPLEKCEQLEQLRALQHGCRIIVAIRPTAAPGIDTPEQYEAFVSRYSQFGGERG